MNQLNWLKWAVGALVAPFVLAALFIAIFGWNWVRGPIERMATERTGRVLVINGDLTVTWGWPFPRIHAGAVTFANPGWAREKHMVMADAVDVTINLPQLLRRNIVLPEVRLELPNVFLEQGTEGRKNWLLDKHQQDEGARIHIERLTLDHGLLGYDDAARKTSIRAELSTGRAVASMQGAVAGVSFTAKGQYKGLPLTASGTGGPVLGLRDEETPYPLDVELYVGRTGVKATGTVTSLLKFTALDMQLSVHGANLADLFPLLGIAFPETRAYATQGHIAHTAQTWRYDKFSGRVGDSDIAGNLQVDTGGKRPAMKAELTSRVLDLADLGPLIGSRPGSVRAARQAATLARAAPVKARVLPDIPFNTDHWDSVDAEVSLKARTFHRARELPLEDLDVHLSLRDSVLILDPLNFGVAGGELKAVITLDGRKHPIQARVKVRAQKLLVAKLFPTVNLSKSSIGQVNGQFELAGTGNSVGRMLATSSGNVGLIVAGGEISRLMMEKAGLHLWEILVLNVTGDKRVKVRCGVADFNVRDGVMRTNALVFDTEVTTITGAGAIDLGQERLDLTLNPKTKNTSPLALSSPIHIRGSFAKPVVMLDKGRLALRGLGAIALGVVTPFLALIPLIDAGPGQDSDCGKLVREARAVPTSGPLSAGVHR